MRALVLLVAALVWLAAGCATTRMTSQVNPEIAGRNYARVLVYGDFQSLEQRQLAEGKLCEQLRKWTECECVQSLDIFFPAQEYTNEQFVERIVANAVDSILTLQPTDSGTTTTYDPGYALNEPMFRSVVMRRSCFPFIQRRRRWRQQEPTTSNSPRRSRSG